MLGQDVNLIAVLLPLGEKLDLRQHLVGEAGGHHETRMSGRIAEIQKSPL